MLRSISLQNPSAQIIANNEDLLIEILLRLPAKPLIRFKSVSKHWLNLISSSEFSLRHTRHNPNLKISGVFLRKSMAEFEFLPLAGDSDSSGAPFKSLDFVQDPAGIKILQSCNGLLLCSSLSKIGTNRNYYVYNPTTKQFSVLPSLISEKAATVFGVNLVFDPSKSPYYKVICVRSTFSSIYYYQIDIYSSETGAWRTSGSPFVASFNMVFSNGVFCNGAVHWISPKGDSLNFHVENECLEKMPNIPIMESWAKRKFRYFGESDGFLHLIEVYGPCSAQFKVFVMEKDCSKWSVKYHVDLNPVIRAFPEMARSYEDSTCYVFVVLALVEEENEDKSFLLLHIPGKVISYRLKDKSFKKIYEFEQIGKRTNGSSLQFGWLDAYQYIESLACV